MQKEYTPALAHLSDPHITTGALGGAPAEALSCALGRALALDPQPDAVVITGYLVDRGRPGGVRGLAGQSSAGSRCRCISSRAIDDDPEALRDAFGGTAFLGDTHDTHYVVELPAFTVVGAGRPRCPDHPVATWGRGQLAWLDEGKLARRPDVPALLCLHHPPIPVGIPFLGRDAAGRR